MEVNAVAISVRLRPELDERLTRLAQQTNRSKTFYVTQALEEQIDHLEHVYSLRQDLEDYRAGRLETMDLDEFEEYLELDD